MSMPDGVMDYIWSECAPRFMSYKVGLQWDCVKRSQKVKKWDYLVVVVVFWTQRIALRGTEVVLMGTESVLERNAVKKSLATPYPL